VLGISDLFLYKGGSVKKKFVVIGLIVVSLAGLGVWAQSNNLYQLLRTFGQVLKLVQENYVQEVDSSELVRSAIKGMLSKLDPHSTYLTQHDYRELQIHTQGKYGGLGFVVSKVDNAITVISPFEGTPAERAGLQPGDRIVKIDGVLTLGMEVDEAVSKMRGAPGTPVTLTIEREGIEEPIDFYLTREIIELKNVQYAGLIQPNVGYIRLSGFSEGAGEEVRLAVDSLLAHGARKFLLDLRANPGGLLNEAVNVVDNFLPPGRVVVSTKGRAPRANRDFYSTSKTKTHGLPIIVLVDGASASASEIVAGAVQDWDIGLIVGDTTFGKGSVQTVLPIEAGEAVKLTTARYYIPSGRCIDMGDTSRFLLRNPTLGKKFTSVGGLGREFESHGSIVPDVVLESVEMPSIIADIQRSGLFMQYTSKYAREHSNLKRRFEVDSLMLGDFRSFLKKKEMKFSEAEFDSGGEAIKKTLKSMIAEDMWGTEGKYEVLLSEDPWVQASIELLSKASSDTDLFRIAGVTKK